MLEVLVAIFIIAILALLALPLYAKLRARAQRAQCMANLRSLSVAAEQFLQQNGSWPQIGRAGTDDSSMIQYSRDWIEALKPFGAQEKTWICPTVQNDLDNPDYTQGDSIRIDYLPMNFDDKPTTPHEWPRQPWFLETANSHGNGPLIIFTDGSISDSNSLNPK